MAQYMEIADMANRRVLLAGRCTVSSITDMLIGILIMGNALISDIRYYRNAVRFGMDDLNGVNELANKYPEARPMINRKQKTDMEEE